MGSPPQYRVGPAGWSYPDWYGPVYGTDVRRSRSELALVVSWFDLIEINSTHYRLPSDRTVARWIESARVRPEFRFTVKLPRRFTHEHRLDGPEPAECRRLLDRLLDAGVLGCALVQFPWSFQCRPEEKRYLHRLLDTFEGAPLAVEVRHGGWNTPEYRAYLTRRQVAFCNIDQPLVGGGLGLTGHVTARFAYLRLHGRNERNWFDPQAGRDGRYDYWYTEAEVDGLARLAADLGQSAGVVYVVTNNHYRGKAIWNARQLMDRLGGIPPPGCPPPPVNFPAPPRIE